MEPRVLGDEDSICQLESVTQRAEGWWPDLEDLHTCFNTVDADVEFGQRGMLAYAFSYFLCAGPDHSFRQVDIYAIGNVTGLMQ